MTYKNINKCFLFVLALGLKNTCEALHIEEPAPQSAPKT